ARHPPTSAGGTASAQRHAELNGWHKGDPAYDTADFSGAGQGNLRVDYVLPSRQLRVVGSGVYWPAPGEPGSRAIRATDHRLVWTDFTWRTGNAADGELPTGGANGHPQANQ